MTEPRKPLGDYEVGFAKPPKASQFQKGRSGNPKGRPKGSLDFATILKHALDEMVTVTENGRPKRRTKKEIMTKVTVNKALKGDLRAWMELVKLSRESGLDQPALEAEVKPLPASHAAIIARALAARREAEERADDEDGEGLDEAA